MVSCVRAALLVALSTPPVALGRSRAQLPCVRPPCLSRAPRARRCAARAMPEPGKELPLKRSKSESLSEDEELLPFPSAPRAGRLLLPLLLAAYVHNQWSRSLIYYVVDFGDTDAPGSAQKLMNAELGFGPGTYSVLATIAFSALFAPLSLIAGSASDVGDRAFITWASLLGWSAATAWQGSAHSVWEVAASRSMQGVAQAFTTPAAYTLLADATPPARRGTVNSVYTTGVYIGGGLAALSIILDRALGWRGAEWAVAGVGGVTAIACAALLEDPREAARARGLAVASASSTDSTADAVRARIAEQLSSLQRTAEAVADSPATQLLLASAALRFCAGFSIAVWIGPWGRLVFPDREADFAVAKALISCLGGGFSAVAGGVLSDKLSQRGGEGRRLWVPVAGSVLAALCWLLMLDASTFELAMCWLLLQYLCAECWFGSTVAVLQQLLPDDVQGGAQGAFSMLTVVGNLAPLLIGALQETRALPDVLREVVPALYVASALCFAVTARKVATVRTGAKSGPNFLDDFP